VKADFEIALQLATEQGFLFDMGNFDERRLLCKTTLKRPYAKNESGEFWRRLHYDHRYHFPENHKYLSESILSHLKWQVTHIDIHANLSFLDDWGY
jgi:hypothetical protein